MSRAVDLHDPWVVPALERGDLGILEPAGESAGGTVSSGAPGRGADDPVADMGGAVEDVGGPDS